MKLFQEITEVYKYQKASEFIKEFQIGEGERGAAKKEEGRGNRKGK